MNLFKIFLFTAVIVVSTLAAKITVIGPQTLADQFTDNDIVFSLSHFGTVPYGAHLVGQVFLAEPIDACGRVEPFHEGENTLHENVIAVIERGGCRISIKVRNAQFAGAKIVILVNDNDGEQAEYFGHEQGAEDIKIPTLMVKKTDGQKIIQALEGQNIQTPQSSEESQTVTVSVSFPYDPKSTTAQLDFWYSTADTYKSSFIFLKRFYEQWKKNKDAITFLPHFVTWTCGECKKQEFKVTTDPDCLSGGRYCAPDPDEGGRVTGADVVKEDLRQACIYRASQDLWWNYVIGYGEKCLDSQDIASCSDSVLRPIAPPDQYAQIGLCVKMSFDSGDKNVPADEKFSDNTILREEKELQLEYSIHQFPVLFINHKPYYGKLQHANLVFEEVCRNLETLTDDCKVALARTGESTATIEQHHAARVLVLILMMTILAVLVFYCCRRMIKSESKDMSLEVGGLVTKYFALRDTNEQTREEETS